MGDRTSYAPGTFSWIDLATTDPAGAKDFYAALFGWEAEDVPAGEAGTYTMLRLGGKDVAALYELRADELAQGVPPHWKSYVTVEDVDACARLVDPLEGAVLVEPFDVMDAGRMALVRDPVGAVLALWQPESHVGAAIVNVPGALTWNELQSRDVAPAFPFYDGLFGWQFVQMTDHPAYWSIRHGERSNGGVLELTPDMGEIPPNWHPYFGVASVEDSVPRVRELGGTVLMPGMDVPAGRFAIVHDPQGAYFTLFAGDFDD